MAPHVDFLCLFDRPSWPSHAKGGHPQPRRILQTLREQDIERLRGAIMSKPEWWTKVQQPELRAKWAQEAIDAGMNPDVVTYAIDECLFLAERHVCFGVRPAPVEDVYESDSLVELSLLRSLRDEVLATEARRRTMGIERDYHPGSNNLVIDHVHPSLYCYVHGTSPVLPPAIERELASQEGKAYTVYGDDGWHEATEAEQPPTAAGAAADIDMSQLEDEIKRVLLAERSPPTGGLWQSWVNTIAQGVQIDPSTSIGEVRGRFEGCRADDSLPMPSRIMDRSARYQWLPAEFRITHFLDDNIFLDPKAVGKVEIRSYINNLNPENDRRLYTLIAKIFGRCVPLLQRVILSLESPLGNRFAPGGRSWFDPPYLEEDSEGDERGPDTRTFLPPEVPNFSSSRRLHRRTVLVSAASSMTRREWELSAKRSEAEAGSEVNINRDATSRASVEEDLRRIDLMSGGQCMGKAASNLQVIVKISSIELTSENPRYDGGVWHLEGMANERIMATCIVYYDVSESLTESRLAFRAGVEDPGYEQDERRGVREMYGLVDGQQINQPLGAVVAKQGRCVAFPNTMQHMVLPFELRHGETFGRRSILCFFLVDVNVRILSTSMVPPQQEEWFVQYLVLNVPALRALWNREPELVRKIVRDMGNGTPFYMTLESARRHRLALMEERKAGESQSNRRHFARTFSLCEH